MKNEVLVTAKNAMVGAKDQVVYGAAMLASSFMMSPFSTVHATKGNSDGGTTGIGEIQTVTVTGMADGSTDAGQIIGSILGIILKVATFVGAAMLLWGLVMFGLAIKNDEPESKQKALMTAFAGVVLVTLRSILVAAKIIQ